MKYNLQEFIESELDIESFLEASLLNDDVQVSGDFVSLNKTQVVKRKKNDTDKYLLPKEDEEDTNDIGYVAGINEVLMHSLSSSGASTLQENRDDDPPYRLDMEGLLI